MASDISAIRMGLLVWVVGTIGAFVGMFFALRRTAWAAIGCTLLAPFCLALLASHFALGAKSW